MDQFDNIDYQEQNHHPQYHTKTYRYQTKQSTSCKTDPEDNKYLICTQKSSDGNNNYQRTYKKQIQQEPAFHHNNFFNLMQQMRSFPNSANFAFNAITQTCQNDPEDNTYLLCTQTKNNGNGKQAFTFRKPKLENNFSQFRPFAQVNRELQQMSKGMEQIDTIFGLLGGGLFNTMNFYSDHLNPPFDSNYHQNNFTNMNTRQSFPESSQQFKNTQHKNSPYNFSWNNTSAQEMKDI